MIKDTKRRSGILMPVFSLPSPYGIGCFSKEAFDFIDRLSRAGQNCWQILPLGPTSYGDSPYQSFSTFAGNPYFIDPATLTKDGLLTKEECDSYSWGKDEESIDYALLYTKRFLLLRKAFERFGDKLLADFTLRMQFDEFRSKNEHWLDDYCLFMALKDHFGGESWLKWPRELQCREPQAMLSAREEYANDIQFYRFLQFQFDIQWSRLHAYAAKKGIDIIGDIPIYVALDSADAWARPDLFQFDEAHRPIAVAGCPPDGFSATGQLWGNPLYCWENHRAESYLWWIRRIEHCFRLYDIVRIDHFRGFASYYSIPYGEKTAENGKWITGPGIELFQTIQTALGDLPIIAEDLGFLTDEVRDLLSQSGFPGMKVLQFAFDPREESDYLPHTYDRHCVVYTGTHDNETTKGWYENLAQADRQFACAYMQQETIPDDRLPDVFVALAMGSVADLCIIPMQDYLGLGNEARINTPSTLGGNWQWRMADGAFDDALTDKIARMAKLYGRYKAVTQEK